MAGRTAHCHGGKLPDGETLQKLVNDGYGKKQIAERYGVTADHVHRRLKKLGVTSPMDSKPQPARTYPVMQLRGPQRRITLPHVSILAQMEKYA
ncbi:transposase [Rhizobium skierniewicense]|uniref:Transposase n=1 Tax=Rhizobium skierniewicense TaxID=984260 RepID=A0A7W6G0G8_9HYPH|nr:hypothetical protein [Rhizobium skierniewicense]MBB3944675.1 transposase [Rhizobium skierniewicense]